MALSDVKIRTIKPREKAYKFSDEKGLYLYIKSNGSKAWRLKYRFLGKEKTLSIGLYPASHALIDGEIFLGIQKPLSEKLDGQIGLAVAMTGNASLSGHIWNDAEPAFDNYTYNYQIRYTYLALKSKLLADRDYIVIPWLSASLGVGFNQAHGFRNMPTISEASHV